jgi:hypothetical protein
MRCTVDGGASLAACGLNGAAMFSEAETIRAPSHDVAPGISGLYTGEDGKTL